MTTHEIPILGHATMPDSSGDVFQEPYNVKATNAFFDGLVWIFNDSGTRISLYGLFQIPRIYVGAPKIIVDWETTATTGSWEIDVDLRAVAVGESMDQATAQESVNVADAAGGSAHLLQRAELAFSAGTFAALDLVPFSLSRDGTDAGDTMAAAAILRALYFQFSDA